VLNKDTAGDEAEADDIMDLAPYTNCLVAEAWEENIRRQCIMIMVLFNAALVPPLTLL